MNNVHFGEQNMQAIMETVFDSCGVFNTPTLAS